MKSVSWADLVEVGTVLSTHSYDGSLKISIDNSYRKFITSSDWPDDLPHALFMKLRGDMVPLLIESVEGEEPMIFSWKNLSDEENASAYRSASVYLHADAITEVIQAEEAGPLEGYICLDVEQGRLGEVLEYIPDEYGDKLRLQLSSGKELTLPFPEEYVEDLNEEKEEILLRLPDGLWELMTTT